MISRSILIGIVGGALISLLTGLSETFSVIPMAVISSFEVWRLFLYPLFEDRFLTLIFTLMSFASQGPRLEMRVGSAAMAALVG